MSLDYFLYSCFEHENTSRSWPVNTDTRWPTAVSCTNDVPQSIKDRSLAEILTELSQWYVEHSPQLVDSKPLDLESLPDVIPAFMQLTQDMDTVVKAKTGDYLPTYESETSEGAVWSAVNDAIRQNFSNFEKMFLRYLHWSHASQPEEIIDLASRPPVGRFAPNFRRGGSSSNDRRGGKGNSKRPHGGNNKRPPRGKSNDRPQNKRRSGGFQKKNDAKLERDSLKEVLSAIQKLNENPGMKEFKLPPANSYYRRLQHQQIKDEGLFSKSTGEGNSRAVVILTEPSDSENNGNK